ncbi:MAG: hemin uptake protein HemP [Sedimentisphaerales bacterium]
MEINNNHRFESRENDAVRQPRLLESSQLFGGGNEVEIKHKGSVYRLRITKNGKLIMNK